MRITRIGGLVTLRDRVGPYWFLGLFLLSGGVRRLSFTDLAAVELVQGADSDGDPIWRPAARLQSGELVLLSELWSHDKAAVLAGAAAVAESCRLPFSPVA